MYVFHDLGTGFADDVNESHVVVGTTGGQAFRTTPSGLQKLGTLGGLQSRAASINNYGIIVGQAEASGSTNDHPFIYDATGMHDLGSFGGTVGEAHAINDSGQVVGVSRP